MRRPGRQSKYEKSAENEKLAAEPAFIVPLLDGRYADVDADADGGYNGAAAAAAKQALFALSCPLAHAPHFPPQPNCLPLPSPS